MERGFIDPRLARWIRNARGLFLCLVLCLGVLSPGCAPNPGPAFGFEVAYVQPYSKEPMCGTGHPLERRWSEGPHERFQALAPHDLAARSLAWFESSPEAGTWHENESARLQLVYPSDACTLTVRHVPERVWEEELRAWFEGFPPRGSGAQDLERDEECSWSFDLGEQGRLVGVAASESEALAAMRALLKDPATAPLLQQATLSLDWSMRRTSHQTDLYGVQVDGVEQLEELPRLLAEKLARYGQRPH